MPEDKGKNYYYYNLLLLGSLTTIKQEMGNVTHLNPKPSWIGYYAIIWNYICSYFLVIQAQCLDQDCNKANSQKLSL